MELAKVGGDPRLLRGRGRGPLSASLRHCERQVESALFVLSAEEWPPWAAAEGGKRGEETPEVTGLPYGASFLRT